MKKLSEVKKQILMLLDNGQWISSETLLTLPNRNILTEEFESFEMNSESYKWGTSLQITQ